MTIDIRGVNTHNKGAQLMMIAIAERIGDGFDLSVSPNGSEYDIRARLGMKQTLLLNQARGAAAPLSDLVPRGVRRAFGLVSDSDLTGVLDAAGFAYSDSFGPQRARRESAHAARWKKRGVPLVLLPQAFGPFDKPEQREWCSKLLTNASLVFARDRVSLDYVKKLGLPIDVRLSPDFTVGLAPHAVERQIEGEYAAIVPNQKMVSHTAIDERAYIEILIAAGRELRARGLEPVVVIHEFNDIPIGKRVADALACRTFSHPDPLVLKRVLGDASAAVASRFHAIVGALSQGTPVLAFGWSHKYKELLADFGVPQWLFDEKSDPASSIDTLFADGSSRTLADHGTELRGKNDRMWDEVVGLLESADH
ncbi:colanic acid/amylovoran biosynthesis protein [Rathayibacter sp. PhB93]|uniref:polysaccharide pyruvyl transferase family protein n=1 Tax=unclassified Rathayibacter TaxID=2609250 RepID=UPI000F462A44|nr:MULTISPECIES: polysaccharide pyruvyl transferase family protein [unclassified Rathayibacter]ROQ06266.1 colanic acid/amylovoran biosynthesis protein [Rathayibacter sp. PhB93]TDQ14023.1 colanic acid/amylovoran biosynthesis protein [Rathayibacter sp. PhB1]